MERMPDSTAQPVWDTDFTHSKIADAKIGDRSLKARDWIEILVVLHEELFSRLVKKMGDKDQARDQMIKMSPSNVEKGGNPSFHYAWRLKCSIQRMDAKSTWRHYDILRNIIREIDPGFDIVLTVRWKNKPEAAFPGQVRTWRPLVLNDVAP